MLSDKYKVYLKRLYFVALVAFVFGLFIWLSFFRVVRIQNQYALVLVGAVQNNHELIFNYPYLDSPLQIANAQVENEKIKVFFENGEADLVDEDLILGRLLCRIKTF